ncbi:MAG: rhodanese-like domain-containing protein, partial [Planctomycetota bacterium]
SYFMAMVADGIGEPGDTLVILCQTGYRASFAAMELKKLNTMYSLGISEIVVLYGGELAWRDDWSLDDTPSLDANCDANDTSDPSPDDDPANSNMPPYLTPVPWPNSTTWMDCDPDDVPGAASLGYTNTLTAPYKYDAPGQLGTCMGCYAWNGTEPHVAVKPWWMDYMGSPPGANPAGDSMLSLSINSVGWASWSDYSSVPHKLSVSYKLTNNAPMDVTPAWPAGSTREQILPSPYYMNYDDSCTGYGATGSGCE